MISSLRTAEGFHSFFAISDQPTTQEAPPANVSKEGMLNRLDRGFRKLGGAVGWGLLGAEITLSCILFSSAQDVSAILAGQGARSLPLAPPIAGYVAASFVVGVGLGVGLNYLPLAFGSEKTAGDYLGDAATAVFGPCDTQGAFFRVGEFFGLA